MRNDAHALLARAGAIDAALRLVVTRGGRRIGILHPPTVFAPTISLATIAYAPTRVLDGVKVLLRRGDLRPNAAGVMPDAQPSRTGGRPGCGRAGQTLSVIGHSDPDRENDRETDDPALQLGGPVSVSYHQDRCRQQCGADEPRESRLAELVALVPRPRSPVSRRRRGALSGTTISCSIM